MRPIHMAAAGLAMAALASIAQAQTPPAPDRVGIQADPCAALDPAPVIVVDYMQKLAAAKAARQPPPIPTPAGLAVYNAWRQRLLLQDFSGRCHYQAANAALDPSRPPKEIFFGDSITELWGATMPGFFSASRLDRGVSGQTTPQMLGRFQADVIDLHPRLVHILAGTNDIAGNTGPTSLAWIEANIRAMATLAKANHIQVVIGSVLPAAGFNWRPGITPAADISALNAWLEAYARAEGFVYVDYYAVLAATDHSFKAAMTLDGVHPNAVGYQAMAPLAERALAQSSGR